MDVNNSSDGTTPSYPSPALPELRKTVATLFVPGTVTELRTFKNQERPRSGYFDDQEALTQEANKLDLQGWEVYATLNPVNTALLERTANRVSNLYTATTADDDIVRLWWIVLRFDPVRPSEMLTKHEERTAVFELAKKVRTYLRAEGWPDPVIADPGNGFDFLYRIDLPNDWESRQLMRGVLKALAAEFDNERVKIDPTVYNAAHQVRLYGTMNREGEVTDEQPYRRSKISLIPKEGMKIVAQEMLETIASRGQTSFPEDATASHIIRGLDLLLEKHPEYESERDPQVLIDAVIAQREDMYFLFTLTEMVEAMKSRGMQPTAKAEAEVIMRRMQRADLDPQGDN